MSQLHTTKYSWLYLNKIFEMHVFDYKNVYVQSIC